MRVGVIGSWDDQDQQWVHRASREAFIGACIEIGKTLAQHGHRLVVESDLENTADKYVSEGFVQAALAMKSPSLRIEVFKPTNEESPFLQLAKEHPSLFVYHPVQSGQWWDVRMAFADYVDSVLAVGGKEGTFVVGLETLLANKCLVSIGSFGGASEQLLSKLVARKADENNDHWKSLAGPWTSVTAEVAVKLVADATRQRLLLIHGRKNDWLALKDWLRDNVDTDVYVMQQEFGGGATLPEKFETVASKVDGAIAIATPDDIGHIKRSTIKNERARQNVWLEVGWVWGRLGRNRLMVLVKGPIEFPSDLQGLEYYEYQQKPTERSEDIRKFIDNLRESA